MSDYCNEENRIAEGYLKHNIPGIYCITTHLSIPILYFRCMTSSYVYVYLFNLDSWGCFSGIDLYILDYLIDIAKDSNLCDYIKAVDKKIDEIKKRCS